MYKWVARIEPFSRIPFFFVLSWWFGTVGLIWFNIYCFLIIMHRSTFWSTFSSWNTRKKFSWNRWLLDLENGRLSYFLQQHCLHVGITHAGRGARQVYDYFHKGFPCIWKPLHNHSATMPPPLILMIGVEWIGSIGKGGTLMALRNQ